MKDKCEELRWIRAFSPDVIPRYLVEKVKDRDYDVDDFFKYMSLNCMIDGKDGPTLNPFNHLYSLATDDNFVKGYAWMVIDPLTKDLIVNTYSVDDEYWQKGKAVKKLSDFVKKIMKQLKIKKVYWITKYPKHSERHGFKKSKHVLMEYSEDTEVEEKDKNTKKEKKDEKITVAC